MGYDDVSFVKELLIHQKRLLPPCSHLRLGPEDGSSKLLQSRGTIYQPIHFPNQKD